MSKAQQRLPGEVDFSRIGVASEIYSKIHFDVKKIIPGLVSAGRANGTGGSIGNSPRAPSGSRHCAVDYRH